jgi:hypothetical protein
LAQFLRECSCSEEVRERILTHIDKLGLGGYKSVAVGRIVNSRLDIIALLPFIDNLRHDSADAVDNLTDMGLSAVVLTGDLRHLPHFKFDFVSFLYLPFGVTKFSSFCIWYLSLLRKPNGYYKACLWKTWKIGCERATCQFYAGFGTQQK